MDDAPPDTTTQHNSAQHELALCDRCHTWASGAHGWVPAGHPRYTRADYDQEAVGGSTSRARARDTSHRHTSCEQGWRPNSLVAEYMAAEHPPHVSGARVQSTEASVHGSAPVHGSGAELRSTAVNDGQGVPIISPHFQDEIKTRNVGST